MCFLLLRPVSDIRPKEINMLHLYITFFFMSSFFKILRTRSTRIWRCGIPKKGCGSGMCPKEITNYLYITLNFLLSVIFFAVSKSKILYSVSFNFSMALTILTAFFSSISAPLNASGMPSGVMAIMFFNPFTLNLALG